MIELCDGMSGEDMMSVIAYPTSALGSAVAGSTISAKGGGGGVASLISMHLAHNKAALHDDEESGGRGGGRGGGGRGGRGGGGGGGGGADQPGTMTPEIRKNALKQGFKNLLDSAGNKKALMAAGGLSHLALVNTSSVIDALVKGALQGNGCQNMLVLKVYCSPPSPPHIPHCPHSLSSLIPLIPT